MSKNFNWRTESRPKTVIDTTTRLIKNDFMWDVRVRLRGNEDKKVVWIILTLNTIDDFGQETEIEIEMTADDLDKFLEGLKKKV